MTLRAAHIINLLFGLFILLISFNILDFFYFWRGFSGTPIVKIVVALTAFYLLPKSTNTPNLAFQIWTFFSISFIVIAYPVTLFYKEIHPTIDPSLLIRSFVYNYLVTIICYKFTIFSAQRGELNRLINGVLIAFILTSIITL